MSPSFILTLCLPLIISSFFSSYSQFIPLFLSVSPSFPPQNQTLPLSLHLSLFLPLSPTLPFSFSHQHTILSFVSNFHPCSSANRFKSILVARCLPPVPLYLFFLTLTPLSYFFSLHPPLVPHLFFPFTLSLFPFSLSLSSLFLTFITLPFPLTPLHTDPFHSCSSANK